MDKKEERILKKYLHLCSEDEQKSVWNEILKTFNSEPLWLDHDVRSLSWTWETDPWMSLTH